MKKITYYLLIAVMAICFTSKVDFAQTTVTKQLDYPTAIKTYQLQSNQDLLIMVNNVRRYDVLSVEPDNSDNKSIKLQAWEVSYNVDAAVTRSTSAIQSINTLSDANVSFNNGILIINASGGNKRAVIHLGVPLGLRTKILVNGVEYHNGNLSTSAMVQDGHLNNPNSNANPMVVNVRSPFNPNAGYTPEFSLISAISPKVGSTTDLSKAFKRIDANTLSNLAIKKVTPPLSQDKGQSYALVNIEVNELGQVTSVSYIAGDTKLADFSSPTLKQFTFQPFILNGKAIKIASFVNVTSLDGKVTLFGKIK